MIKTSYDATRKGVFVMTGSKGPNAKTVLVVDDEQDVLILLKLILETHGYRALLARGAEAALRFLRQDELTEDLFLGNIREILGAVPLPAHTESKARAASSL